MKLTQYKPDSYSQRIVVVSGAKVRFKCHTDKFTGTKGSIRTCIKPLLFLFIHYYRVSINLMPIPKLVLDTGKVDEINGVLD